MLVILPDGIPIEDEKEVLSPLVVWSVLGKSLRACLFISFIFLKHRAIERIELFRIELRVRAQIFRFYCLAITS